MRQTANKPQRRRRSRRRRRRKKKKKKKKKKKQKKKNLTGSVFAGWSRLQDVSRAIVAVFLFKLSAAEKASRVRETSTDSPKDPVAVFCYCICFSKRTVSCKKSR